MISLPVNHFDPNAKSELEKSEPRNPTLLTRDLQTQSLEEIASNRQVLRQQNIEPPTATKNLQCRSSQS
jgi:hypothetical protein